MSNPFQRNLIILLLMAVAAFNLAVYAGMQHLLSDSFEHLEQVAVEENLQRALNAVEYDLEGLATLNTDWSAWDDTYDFIVNNDADYIESNLPNQTLTDLHLNSMLFFNTSGDLVFGKAMNLREEEEVEVSAEFLERLTQYRTLWRFDKELALEGLILLPDGPALVSSQSILTSKSKGPPRGLLVMIRYLDSEVIAQLSQRTALSLHVQAMHDEQAIVSPFNAHQTSIQVDPEDPDRIRGYALLQDLDGNTILTLSVEMRRDLFHQGEKTVGSFLRIFFIVSSLFGMILYLLIMKNKNAYNESEKRFRYVFENVNDGLFVVEPCGKIKLMNEAAQKLLGIKVPIDHWSSLTALNSDVHFQELISAGLAGETREVVDIKLTVPSRGKNQYIAASVSPLKGSGKDLSGAIVCFSEITGQKEADQLKSEFIASAAHELSTPLASIMGYSELLLNKNELDSGQQREFLSIINEKSDALEKIINDLLHLGKIESGGKAFLKKVSFDLQESLNQLIAIYRDKTETHQIENRLPERSINIVADRHSLNQVFDNLLSNAIKYSPTGGKITISGEVSPEELVICIEDNGNGLYPHELDRVFEKFYRTDSATNQARGLGLGLCICRDIIKEHGGTIWIESQPGEGTRAFFTLPL